MEAVNVIKAHGEAELSPEGHCWILFYYDLDEKETFLESGEFGFVNSTEIKEGGSRLMEEKRAEIENFTTANGNGIQSCDFVTPEEDRAVQEDLQGCRDTTCIVRNIPHNAEELAVVHKESSGEEEKWSICLGVDGIEGYSDEEDGQVGFPLLALFSDFVNRRRSCIWNEGFVLNCEEGDVWSFVEIFVEVGEHLCSEDNVKVEVTVCNVQQNWTGGGGLGSMREVIDTSPVVVASTARTGEVIFIVPHIFFHLRTKRRIVARQFSTDESVKDFKWRFRVHLRKNNGEMLIKRSREREAYFEDDVCMRKATFLELNHLHHIFQDSK
ncbi:hypothetical protein BU15DRAFT_67785 [Melanogaster broomeanus]|nr:hypothetical protein BU15DRAFT_67785 [Melanogaster broomeanus]